MNNYGSRKKSFFLVARPLRGEERGKGRVTKLHASGRSRVSSFSPKIFGRTKNCQNPFSHNLRQKKVRMDNGLKGGGGKALEVGSI